MNGNTELVRNYLDRHPDIAKRNPSLEKLLGQHMQTKRQSDGSVLIGPKPSAVEHKFGGEIKPRRSKYNANPTTDSNGHRHDSKAEARYDAEVLDPLVAAGKIIYYLRQVPIALPGGVKMVIDRQIHWMDGSVTYVDIKGVTRNKKTGRVTSTIKQDWRNKAKQVESMYPFLITVAWWDKSAREWVRCHWRDVGTVA